MTPAFRAVMRKEIRQVMRDRRLLPMLLVAPVIQLLVFGYAVNFDVDRIRTRVCDLDGTPASRALVQGLLAEGTFEDAGPVRDCGRPEEEVRLGRAEVVVVVPPGLARDLAAERPVDVQVLADGTNPTIGRFADTATRLYFESAGLPWAQARVEAVQGRLGREVQAARLAPEIRMFYNPRMKSAIFMVPGVAAMILLVVTMIATSMGLAREKEMGTLEQVMVTPIRPAELLLGKVLPFVALGAVDVLAAVTLGAWVFDVPVRGSLALLAGATLLFLLSTVGLGLFLSTVARSQQQAFLFAFFVMMPGMLLSGIMTPIANMPRWLQPVTWVNPIRYYVEVLRGVLLKGADAGDLWLPLVALAAFGVAILAMAVARFRKRLA